MNMMVRFKYLKVKYIKLNTRLPLRSIRAEVVYLFLYMGCYQIQFKIPILYNWYLIL